MYGATSIPQCLVHFPLITQLLQILVPLVFKLIDFSLQLLVFHSQFSFLNLCCVYLKRGLELIQGLIRRYAQSIFLIHLCEYCREDAHGILNTFVVFKLIKFLFEVGLVHF